MAKIVSAKTDVVFKKLFTDRENLHILRGFLADILDIPKESITNISVENAEVTPEEIEKKFTRFDAKLTVDDRLINIEMQVHNYGDFKERSLYYWLQRYGGQLKKGEAYIDVQTTISINILNFTLFEHEDYRSLYTMADLEHNMVLTDKCAMYFFELPKLSKSEDDSKARQWMQVIKADSEEELDMLAAQATSVLNDCIMVIKRYNADEEIREMARKREETIREEISALRHAENKGRREGRREGIELGAKQERETIIANIENMRNQGMSDEDILKIVLTKAE